MASPTPKKQLIPLLRESVNAYITHPILLFPFVTIAFVQILLLEVLYFAPRFPLVKFFGPLIQRLEGEAYLHYPQNLLILPKWFQIAQYFIYVLIGSLLTATAIAMIANLNNQKKTTFGAALRSTLPRYLHLVIAAIITFFVFQGLSGAYGLCIRRALQIRSETGLFHLIKAIVLYGAPYFNLLIGVLVTVMFAFVFPIIVIDQKKVFSAILLNFRHLWRSFWFIFFVILIPTLFYVPVMLLRDNLGIVVNLTFEGMRLLLIILSIVVMIVIDATIYTAITTYYLFKKEQ
ncbi:MAG: hypothetical protein A3G91_02710 [Omnitrophica WOR_2 bacterium RIFCSPLOWO2_12_FULL_50_9]|nr:MAG: hypothetical protein A3G91_02710 [Omnitrophica WOR_2 bacterium RIFCSPLOWO2_12_FULL_50_9]